MTLEEALKLEDYDTRILCGSRWMYWSGVEWIVREQKPYSKKSTIIARTPSVSVALAVLITRDEDSQ